MEYCGGGDLSSVLKQAQRHGRPIPEESIWNYFLQILLALNYCHHPNGHGRTSSVGGVGNEDGKERRPQVLHRDLKPDNGGLQSLVIAALSHIPQVFLDENNTVKLGDFGLSKALPQATFANTYVGVRRPVFLIISESNDLARHRIICLLSSCRRRHTTLSLISGPWVVSSTNYAH